MLWIIKVSPLLFYYQLTNWRPLRIAIWVVFGILTASTIAGEFGYIFQCSPVDWWLRMSYTGLPKGGIVLMMIGFTNIFTDAVIWIMPMPLLWKLQVPKKDRNWAVFIFGLGLVSCIAGGFKLYEIYKGWLGLQTSLQDNGGGMTTLFGNLEPLCAIICASLPALRPLARKYAPKLVSTAEETVAQEENGRVTRADVENGVQYTGSDVALSPVAEAKQLAIVSTESHGSNRESPRSRQP